MLLRDVHIGLTPPPECDDIVTCSNYSYHHYLSDGFDDRGWGCGYRTLQTICSWINSHASARNEAPAILDIQEILVAMGDKETNFTGSKQWIGSVEVGLVIDKLFDVPCKILHVTSGSQFKNYLLDVRKHFIEQRSPIMMGGESDTTSKGLIGLATSSSTGSAYILVLDPHYTAAGAKATSRLQLQNDDWVKWLNIDSLHQHTFYNLCMPQTRHLVALSPTDHS